MLKRAFHLVVLVVLLLSGTALPASVMPCCKIAAKAPVMEMPMPQGHCHSMSGQAIAPQDSMCAHATCGVRQSAPSQKVETVEAPAQLASVGTLLDTSALLPANTARLAPQELPPPLRPTRAPLPLRI